MYSKTQKLLRARSELLCNSQFEDLAKLYKLPFIAFHDGFPNLIKDHSQLIESFSNIAFIMKARDAVKLSVEVTSVELPKDGRFKAWSRYREINSWGGIISQIDVTQYLVESSRSPLVEMIEAFNCPFAAIWEDTDSFAGEHVH